LHLARIGVFVAVGALVVLHHHLHAFLGHFAVLSSREGGFWHDGGGVWVGDKHGGDELQFFELDCLLGLLQGRGRLFFVRVQVDEYWFLALGLAVAVDVHAIIILFRYEMYDHANASSDFPLWAFDPVGEKADRTL
jgi:hypothetical protein